ncbi:hypothetical protein LJR235_001406 [Pararhizobium sp. LjRoot235]|uniref:hypothetical protein n=1 Tax=Pararhizobium sp. LjRoot235 TaxID=3342291 RepID=UPI003ECE855E
MRRSIIPSLTLIAAENGLWSDRRFVKVGFNHPVEDHRRNAGHGWHLAEQVPALADIEGPGLLKRGEKSHPVIQWCLEVRVSQQVARILKAVSGFDLLFAHEAMVNARNGGSLGHGGISFSIDGVHENPGAIVEIDHKIWNVRAEIGMKFDGQTKPCDNMAVDIKQAAQIPRNVRAKHWKSRTPDGAAWIEEVAIGFGVRTIKGRRHFNTRLAHFDYLEYEKLTASALRRLAVQRIRDIQWRSNMENKI